MRSLLAYLPLALWAAAVLVVGTLSISTGSLPTGADKVAHFVMYGVGGMIAAWTGSRRGRRAGWIALAIVLLTGMADELHQTTLATRQADILDWIADAVGAGFFYLSVRRLLSEKEIDRT